MRTASILDRVAGLGSDKWRVHIRARQMMARGEPVILLTIGEPDQPTPDDLIDATHRALQAGRTGYSSGRGEAPGAGGPGRQVQRPHRPHGGHRPVHLGAGTQSALYLLLTALVETATKCWWPTPATPPTTAWCASTGAVTVPVALRRGRAASGSTPTTWRAR
jgi:arginine:pyruvate transaminase